ncbi:TPA: prepilin peptidase-dependent protein [Citrobacter freundii]
MKKQQGYTLIETLVVVLIIVTLSAAGLYGWQCWQQQQRLWQTTRQLRDYLLQLREDANWHNRDHVISVFREQARWCVVSSVAAQQGCVHGAPFVFIPPWEDVEMVEITPSLTFFGLRNTAWAGHIRLKNAAGEEQLVISSWGRIRLCTVTGADSC